MNNLVQINPFLTAMCAPPQQVHTCICYYKYCYIIMLYAYYILAYTYIILYIWLYMLYVYKCLSAQCKGYTMLHGTESQSSES